MWTALLLPIGFILGWSASFQFQEMLFKERKRTKEDLDKILRNLHAVAHHLSKERSC